MNLQCIKYAFFPILIAIHFRLYYLFMCVCVFMCLCLCVCVCVYVFVFMCVCLCCVFMLCVCLGQCGTYLFNFFFLDKSLHIFFKVYPKYVYNIINMSKTNKKSKTCILYVTPFIVRLQLKLLWALFLFIIKLLDHFVNYI